MKLFKCIVDDGRDVFKTITPAKNKKELLEVYGGNGTFEKIEDVTKDFLNEESTEKLDTDLMLAGWGETERRLICALVEQHIKTR